jgi:5S rRNA maturation endonuclease (ribonuclease M5)
MINLFTPSYLHCIMVFIIFNFKMAFMIFKYLKKIKNFEELSFSGFKNTCLKHNISNETISNVFSAKGNGNNKYVLSIKNQELFNDTFLKFEYESENVKVESALRGNSKLSKSPYSILNFKGNYDDINGISIIFKKKVFTLNFELKKKLIIIENVNTYCDIISFFKNSNINLNEYNFIFGSGNSITNNHFVDFLNEYDSIFCLFDIDLGGLKFFKTLSKNINSKLCFYFDEDNEKKLIKYGNKITNKQYLTLIDLYSNIPELEKVINSIKKNKKFVEQEVFQHN